MLMLEFWTLVSVSIDTKKKLHLNSYVFSETKTDKLKVGLIIREND